MLWMTACACGYRPHRCKPTRTRLWPVANGYSDYLSIASGLQPPAPWNPARNSNWPGLAGFLNTCAARLPPPAKFTCTAGSASPCRTYSPLCAITPAWKMPATACFRMVNVTCARYRSCNVYFPNPGYKNLCALPNSAPSNPAVCATNTLRTLYRREKPRRLI